MANLLFTSLGSLGDIKPMVAIADAAREAGHVVTFATSDSFREVVEAAGLAYTMFGDDKYFDFCENRRSMVDPHHGFSSFLALSNLSKLEKDFDVLFQLAQGADVLVSTPFVMVAHLVAQYRRIPIVSCALSPASLLPDLLADPDPLALEWRSRLNALRQSCGLSPRSFPQMERFNVDLTLGVYPTCIRASHRRTIRKAVDIGYPLLTTQSSVCEELAIWLRGEAFALISFGSFIDAEARHLLEAAIFACEKLNLRCLFVSRYAYRSLQELASSGVKIVRDVPHELVMPHAAVIAHHSGTGTLAASIVACRPLVLLPFGLDQIYNARRMQELGLAEVVQAREVSPSSLLEAFREALAGWPKRLHSWSSARDGIGCEAAKLAIEEIDRLLVKIDDG